jgi:hypothetical protein
MLAVHRRVRRVLPVIRCKRMREGEKRGVRPVRCKKTGRANRPPRSTSILAGKTKLSSSMDNTTVTTIFIFLLGIDTSGRSNEQSYFLMVMLSTVKMQNVKRRPKWIVTISRLGIRSTAPADPSVNFVFGSFTHRCSIRVLRKLALCAAAQDDRQRSGNSDVNTLLLDRILCYTINYASRLLHDRNVSIDCFVAIGFCDCSFFILRVILFFAIFAFVKLRIATHASFLFHFLHMRLIFPMHL